MGKLDIVIHKESGHGYWAEIPAMPGCFTDGATLAEVRKNIVEAAQCWLGMEIKLALKRTRVHSSRRVTPRHREAVCV